VRCPYCSHEDSRVVDSRDADGGTAIRRRRACQECGRRFTTLEEASLLVVKRSGATEPFRRDKVCSGVRKACQGRPVDEDALALLAQRVEECVRESARVEIRSEDVGRAILGPLRDLDEVAYLRFASVYSSFESLEDFEAEIGSLRASRAASAAVTAASSAGPGASASRPRSGPPAGAPDPALAAAVVT
jgi:transcriptional repressor NrdR